MAKRLALIVCVFLTLSDASHIQPRDLAAEAQEQLDELRSIVQGEILAAHNDIDDMKTEYLTYTENIYENVLVDIEQEHETTDAQLNTLKELGNSAGVDVSRCTNIREEVLGRLPDNYGRRTAECIANVNQEIQTVLEDATYIIDIVFNKVHNLENQLWSCRGEILCISPLVTEIQLYKVQLPQNIEKEVQAAESLLSTVELSVESCADTNVSGYIAEAGSIIRDITACIDRLIGW